MKRETLVIRPDKHKRRIGIMPTYAQRDKTKYTRKAKHRNHLDQQSHSISTTQKGLIQWLCHTANTYRKVEKIYINLYQMYRKSDFLCASCWISSGGRADVS